MQEVVGDERSALQAVVAADAELMELREEEEQLNKQLQESSLEEQPKGFDADEASQRLNEVSFCNTLVYRAVLRCHSALGIWAENRVVLCFGRRFGQTCPQVCAIFYCCDSIMTLVCHDRAHSRKDDCCTIQRAEHAGQLSLTKERKLSTWAQVNEPVLYAGSCT